MSQPEKREPFPRGSTGTPTRYGKEIGTPEKVSFCSSPRLPFELFSTLFPHDPSTPHPLIPNSWLSLVGHLSGRRVRTRPRGDVRESRSHERTVT